MPHWLARWFVILGLSMVGVACAPQSPTSTPLPSPPPTATALVPIPLQATAVYPHDAAAFTQGLLWDDGWLYESTGLYGQSSLRQVAPTTGEVVRTVPLPPEVFGEGLALVDGRFIALTWQEQVALVFDADFNLVERIPYEGQGWGLCYDTAAGQLYMSDGSSTLTVRDPQTMAAVATLPIQRNGQPVAELNELECVGDAIYANVWRSAEILRIDKRTGQVTAVYTADLLTAEQKATLTSPAEDVLNGIAYDPSTGLFFITGKRWPAMFVVKLE